MISDIAVELFHATVRISQQLPDGKYGQGTGFLVSAPQPDGTPRVVLVTAAHVLSRSMPADEVALGLRLQDVNGKWRYAPQPLRVRYGGAPLWTQNTAHDIAAITVLVPPAVARRAIPLAWLAGPDVFDRYAIAPGDKMMQLGYPIGLSSTPEGFAILRTGRVASYPLTPVEAYPTFLLDSPVFPGNSGGPVFVRRRGPPGAADDVQFIAGMITQQVEHQGRQMDIGIVTHAAFIRDTIAALDAPAPADPAPALVARPPP